MHLGQKLTEARKKKALSEEQAAAETCIPLAIIRSLEVDDYSGFDSAVYTKNFLKTYSRFLGLNISDVLPRFDELASGPESIFKPNRQTLPNTARPAPTRRSRNPLILAPVLAGIFAFLCFSLFSLFTSGSLPFAHQTAHPGEEPEPLAAEIGKPATEKEESAPQALVTKPSTSPSQQITSGERGAYVDDFHPVSNTVFLKSGARGAGEVLP